jgi:hypothetical protein
MSRDIFVQDIPEDVQAVADIPMGGCRRGFPWDGTS